MYFKTLSLLSFLALIHHGYGLVFACDYNATGLAQNLTASRLLGDPQAQMAMGLGVPESQLNIQNCPSSGQCTPTCSSLLQGIGGYSPMCLRAISNGVSFHACHFSNQATCQQKPEFPNGLSCYCNNADFCNLNNTALLPRPSNNQLMIEFFTLVSFRLF